MSQEKDSSISEDMIFYVDKLEDDFTFYLDADSHKDLKKIESLFKNATTGEAERQFSISETVGFTNLIPSASSPAPEGTLWARLRDPEDDAGRYLLGKLKAEATTEDDKKLIETLGTDLSEAEHERLASLLVTALSENRIDLTTEDELITQSLSAEQAATWEKLKSGDPRRLRHYLIETVFPQITSTRETGRALICLSHVGKCLSVTVRKLKKKATYKPSSAPREDQKRSQERRERLFSVEEYCRPLHAGIFRKPIEQGLLVITGPTKSLKSEITRGLIYLYLEERKKQELALKDKGRAPHLVTFEDPIEMYYASRPAKGQQNVALKLDDQQAGVNYTPRQKPSDAGLLADALSDALRQTPTVFFVGETRSKEEWEVLLDFAATGHLVVTTAHAGSLVEAMRKIFEARKVTTAADRGEIANKLLAVVNLKPGTIDFGIGGTEGAGRTEVVFPALYRRTSRGVAGLTSDGLSALLPHPRSDEQPSCLGRRSFIDELLKPVDADLRLAFGSDKFEGVKKAAQKQASTSDLQGV